MAQSKTGGVYGFLRKSVGSVTYSVSTASIEGGRKQIARMKPTHVRNPKTLAQIVQRMKTGPAQLFYAAFEKAAGSVENNPLSHSFQGVPYGAKSRLRFLQLAMQGEPKAYVPKGINFPVPGVYQVSEGTLPSLPWTGIHDDSEVELVNGDNELSAANIASLQALGVEIGDQITFIGLMYNARTESYDAGMQRIIVAEGNGWERLGSTGGFSDVAIYDDGLDNLSDTLACFACILSRGTTSNAKRSTEFMQVQPEYASLMSPEAYDAAVNSWMEGVAFNSLNSDWYLNQGTTQAFNGEVFKQFLTLAAGSGLTEVSGEFLLGRQSIGGNIVYTIFTSNGANTGTAYMQTSNGWETAAAYTAARVATALGSVNVAYAEYSDSIAAQMSGNV